MIDDHRKAYVCTHVFDRSRPVLLVSREGGSWCFVCGDGHPDDASSYRVVGIGHLFRNDPSLEAIKDLQPDCEAERESVDGAWRRTAIEIGA